MLETEYGVAKPVLMSYGENDYGPRGIFDIDSGELVPYFLWIATRPDGTQVSTGNRAC